ncbi:hypothetical protein MKX03_026946 [Papaver bracteatum]|nr:hypothetical protein MKX03_026946 [Papaver bracteatum]
MTFWGIELNKSRRTVTHKFVRGKGRLRVTQACTGRCTFSSYKARLVIECSIRGQKTPTVLCILERPGKREMCSLDRTMRRSAFLFMEDREVGFSVDGHYGWGVVHLSG